MRNKIRKNLKPLATLPQNGTYFRIDAIGSIRRNPYSHTNHLVDIVVRPLSDSANWKMDSAHLNQVHSKPQECYQISIGESYAYQPGCIIRNGLIIYRPCKPNFDQVICATLDKIKFIPANSKIDLQDRETYLIPPYTYQMGSALSSTLMAIEQDGDPYAILIPTMEILRNCYFSSSLFNQHIFSSDIDDFARSTTKNFCLDERNRRLEICLRKHFPDADAIMIGNILTNARAEGEIKKVWASLMRDTHERRDGIFSPLEIGFPVVGNIRIRAMSIDLPSPHHSRKRKFLTTLLGCHYPLPFSHIELQRENPGSKNSGASGDDLSEGNTEAEEQKVFWLNDVAETEEGNNDPFSNPTAYIDRLFIEIYSDRFPSVQIEKVERDKEQKIRSVPSNKPSHIRVTNQSTSESTFGQSSSAPISIVPKENSDSSQQNFEFQFADFSNFNEICNRLTQSPHVEHITSVVIYGLKEKNEDCLSQFPIINNTNTLTWSIVHQTGSPPRPRQLLIKRVSTRTKGTFYLMEIERREKDHAKDAFAIYLIQNYQRSEMSERVFKKVLLDLASSHFKYYEKIFAENGLKVKSRRHTGTIDDCVNAIMDKMFGFF